MKFLVSTNVSLVGSRRFRTEPRSLIDWIDFRALELFEEIKNSLNTTESSTDDILLGGSGDIGIERDYDTWDAVFGGLVLHLVDVDLSSSAEFHQTK